MLASGRPSGAVQEPSAGGQPTITITPANQPREFYRLRIINQPGGPIDISTSSGTTWRSLGKVVQPATQAAPASAPLAVTPVGTVAGVTPDLLLLRLPSVKSQNRALRILAQGQPAAQGAITTDIPSRGPLFRLVAPAVGSEVSLQRGDRLEALPAAYSPRPGDRLIIRVAPVAAAEPASVTIENKAGGEVVLATPGGIPRVLGKVKQPLRGVGRYAGTERAGCGRVLSWSPTAVLVSTTGLLRRPDAEGKETEERGGFVIQPAEPNLKGITHPASQLLLEALPEGNARPAVSSFFALGAPPSSGDPFDTAPTRVEIRVDGGKWEPVPDLRGTIDPDKLNGALESVLGEGRTVKQGITHLRLLYGGPVALGLERRILLATTPAAGKPQRGNVTITANVQGEGVSFVQFLLNGRVVQLTNQPPYNWYWDTRSEPNGEHLLEIRGLDLKLNVVSSVTTKVAVDN
jgi:hypothetical protein